MDTIMRKVGDLASDVVFVSHHYRFTNQTTEKTTDAIPRRNWINMFG